MKKVLVIGKNGQVSDALARLSQNKKDEYIFWGLDEFDLTKAANYKTKILELKPDFIVNAAAYTAVDKAEEEVELAYAINAYGVEELAKVAKSLNIPFIHISTDYVYKGDALSPYKEIEPIEPQNIYGKSKALGDELALKNNDKTIILRTSWVYSDMGHNFVKTMLKLAETKDELNIIDDQKGCPTSAYEIAKTIIAIIEQDLDEKYGIYHLCAKGETTWFGFAKEIFAQAKELGYKTPSKLIAITTDKYPVIAKKPSYSVMDCTKIEQTFNITRNSWQEELRYVLNNLKEMK